MGDPGGCTRGHQELVGIDVLQFQHELVLGGRGGGRIARHGISPPAALLQDALVAACEAVHRLEKRGKQILPRSVAYYTIQRLKMGRRSTGAGRTDVMSPGCQLDGHASISSLDESVHVSEGEEDFTLGDVLAGRRDDPAQVAVRNTDWAEFMEVLDAPQRYIIKATAEGESYMGQAAQLKVSPSAVTQRRQTIAKRARQFWGDGVLEDAQVLPLWRREMGQR